MLSKWNEESPLRLLHGFIRVSNTLHASTILCFLYRKKYLFGDRLLLVCDDLLLYVEVLSESKLPLLFVHVFMGSQSSKSLVYKTLDILLKFFLLQRCG